MAEIRAEDEFLLDLEAKLERAGRSLALPVILRSDEEIDLWMNAPAEEALKPQRPLPENELIVLPQLKAEKEPLLL